MSKKTVIILHALSIVVAVGIGMFNTPVREGYIDNGGGGTGFIDTPLCVKKAASPDPCSSTASKLVSSYGGAYKSASGSTTYCDVPACVSQSHGNFEYDAD
ncbi:hypothetical protein FACS189443_6120 [Planctomycetales bacterium]|nr:hypothetical protein FACS189443_6120 [Planctomycetales bacterium]